MEHHTLFKAYHRYDEPYTPEEFTKEYLCGYKYGREYSNIRLLVRQLKFAKACRLELTEWWSKGALEGARDNLTQVGKQ